MTSIEQHAERGPHLTLTERVRAVFRELDVGGAPAIVAKPAVATAATAEDSSTTRSAWLEAVDVAAFRDRRVVAGLDASVRAIARELTTSTGRVGDLLKIREAFTEVDVTYVGLSRAPGDSPLETADEAGTRRLSQLSFRTLRTLASLPQSQRRAEARRLVRDRAIDRDAPAARETASTSEVLR
jgi:hypothetical protein